MEINPYKSPTALILDGNQSTKRNMLRIALVALGIAMVVYWGIHFLWHLQHWNLYAKQAESISKLGPLYRSGVDIFAVVAGTLMIRRSVWLIIPFAAHCLAFAMIAHSITGSFDLWFYLPLNFQLTFIVQFFSAMLVMAWYRKGR